MWARCVVYVAIISHMCCNVSVYWAPYTDKDADGKKTQKCYRWDKDGYTSFERDVRVMEVLMEMVETEGEMDEVFDFKNMFPDVYKVWVDKYKPPVKPATRKRNRSKTRAAAAAAKTSTVDTSNTAGVQAAFLFPLLAFSEMPPFIPKNNDDPGPDAVEMIERYRKNENNKPGMTCFGRILVSELSTVGFGVSTVLHGGAMAFV